MTTHITGGTITVEDGTKPAEDYAPARKVRVELSFHVPEGTASADDHIDEAAFLANAKVDALLGRTPKPVSATPEAAKPGRKTKAPVQQAPPADPSAIEDPTPAAGATASQSDPAAIEDTPASGTPTSSTTSADPASFDEWESPAETEITDADLNHKVQETNGELGAKIGDAAAVKIRALIGTFNPDPTKAFTLRQIPQAQRADFLARLAALRA